MFKLQFPISKISTWVECYNVDEDKQVESIALQVRETGFTPKTNS
jgi:hypothetical protein